MIWLLVSDMIISGVITMHIVSRLFCTNMHLADPLKEIISCENLKSNDNYNGTKTCSTKTVATKIANVVPLEQFDSIKFLSSLINKLIGSSVALFMSYFCLYMSVDMDQLLLEKGTGPKYYSYAALWITYNLVQIPTVILSAEICRQVYILIC